VCDAGRATSAAPTYFPEVKWNNKILVDGGFGHTNNPSQAAWNHYDKRRFVDTERDFVNFVNIGTGTSTSSEQESPEQERPAPPRSVMSRFIPAPLGRAYRLLRDLGKIATDSEEVAKGMRMMAKASAYTDPTAPQGKSHRICFERFSADTDVHRVKFDDHSALDHLVQQTTAYLAKPEVDRKLHGMAIRLANSCFQRRLVNAALQTAPQTPAVSPAPLHVSPKESIQTVDDHHT